MKACEPMRSPRSINSRRWACEHIDRHASVSVRASKFYLLRGMTSAMAQRSS